MNPTIDAGLGIGEGVLFVTGFSNGCTRTGVDNVQGVKGVTPRLDGRPLAIPLQVGHKNAPNACLGA